MADTESIITDILRREGDATNDPLDAGGRTKFGISERSNPGAWADGDVTEDEARAIYRNKYITGPGFDRISDHHLRAQLVDFAVNSGPAVAIMKLQEILEVPADGVLGPATLNRLVQEHPEFVSNALVSKRILMICRIVKKNPSQLKFLEGWVTRALEFL